MQFDEENGCNQPEYYVFLLKMMYKNPTFVLLFMSFFRHFPTFVLPFPKFQSYFSPTFSHGSAGKPAVISNQLKSSLDKGEGNNGIM